MRIFDKEFEEIFSSQIVSILGGLLVGIALAIFVDKLFIIPGMLILLPGFLEMRGNISGSLSARLTSGLFLGIVKPNTKRTKIVKGNIIASFLLVVFVTLLLGCIAFLINFFVFDIFMLKIILIPLAAGILSNIIEIPLTLFFTFYLFRKGLDPNDIMGPFVTTTGDITSVASLLIVMVII